MQKEDVLAAQRQVIDGTDRRVNDGKKEVRNKDKCNGGRKINDRKEGRRKKLLCVVRQYMSYKRHRKL